MADAARSPRSGRRIGDQAEAPRHAARPRPRPHRQDQHAARPPRDPRHDRPGAAPRHGRGRRRQEATEKRVMRVHDLKPAPGSHRARQRVGRGIGGKGGKTAGRGTKGQKARNTVARGFEGGQMPLKQRVPKLQGLQQPVPRRVPGHQPRRPRRASSVDEVTPATLHGPRPRPQGRAGQGARPGRADAARCTVKAHALLEVGRSGHHRRRRYASRSCPRRSATAARRPRATSSPTAERRSTSSRCEAYEEPCVLSSLQNMFKVPDLRNKILFTLLMIVALPARRAHPGARHRLRRGQARSKDAAEEGGVLGVPQPVLRRRAHPVRRLRARDHAVHHRRRSSCRSSAW